MGKYPEDWERHLRGIAERKYNAVHFTPLTQRGRSDSPFSIYDQTVFDDTCFPNGEEDVQKLTGDMENTHGLLPFSDVVWNHTADNSPWLLEHPEAGYNVQTAPWLEPALLLDDALLRFGNELADHKLPTYIKSLEDLREVMEGIKRYVLIPLELWQFYVIDIEENARAIVDSWEEKDLHPLDSTLKNMPRSSVKDYTVSYLARGLRKMRLGPRFSRIIHPPLAGQFLQAMYGDFDASLREDGMKTMTEVLNILNVTLYQEYDEDFAITAEQIEARLKYLRLDDHGPQLGVIGEDSPLVESYFTRLPHNQTTSKHPESVLALVNNGWVWAADAMRDNAGPDSKAYLRREVIVWSDCVKLRYGKSPRDNPWLWEHMIRYTRLTAKYFKGFRIDNCHSTPIHVAEYLLDRAREVRPNLAVFAELFTGSEEMDYVFVKRLGISSLIREAMQAWSTQELSRLIHMHGGRPIGSFEIHRPSKVMITAAKANGVNGVKSEHLQQQELVHRIRPNQVHALFADCTHDNQMPAQKRDARDTLPNSALVSMCASATGSVMGYDEIYPKHIDLVKNTRQYQSPYSEGKLEKKGCREGIGLVKAQMNEFHAMMGKQGYDETFIDHQGEFITVHRMHPRTRRGYFLAAHTAFPGSSDGNRTLAPVHLAGSKVKMLGCWELEVDAGEETKNKVWDDKTLLRGLPSTLHDLKSVEVRSEGRDTKIIVDSDFSPGSVAMFKTSIPSVENAEGLDDFITSGTDTAFADLDLIDLNFALYRCNPEELDSSGGAAGVYDVPGYGPLVYAGLQGWWSVLKDIVKDNDLGHPLCKHLREGQWALDYIPGRLDRIAKQRKNSSLSNMVSWFTQRFNAVRGVPSYLLPRYFAIVVQTAYDAAWQRSLERMSDEIRHGQPFLQSLAMVSIQQTGLMKSASLYPTKSIPSLAAGLPHFSSDWARCWGRDVFISLRGLFLGTGRFDEAREHILAFASVLKHGMIPNLLSGGKNPRYNSRDSVWFFLQTIQDYVKIVPKGHKILDEPVTRRFLPYDDTYFDFDNPRAYSKQSTIEDIIQEALQRHATGLSFREYNAGPDLDMQMTSEGFNIDVKVDWETGIIFGGSQSNCGTWMDKMGESEKAGSKGIPGTPRDGAAIEITGLLYSNLIWLNHLQSDGKYNYKGVTTVQGKAVSFNDWAARIKHNFERCFFVPLDPAEDKFYDVDSSIINRRGIYKDCYKSGKPYEDYQLRPNFPIAMTVAPSLFETDHALHALELADKVLRGPTGMATLDPSDLQYRPYYSNSEDSTDFATSKGRNYHQGPEWLWPTGFFLRALLKFDLKRRKTQAERTDTFQQITQRLEGCKKAIKESPWAGLTELTNRNGEFCADSVSSSTFTCFALTE